MKNIYKLITIFVLFILTLQSAHAGCSTGYACSISDLNKIEQQEDIETAYFINNYFNKQIEEPMFLNKENRISSYRDLFIFNRFV